MSLNAGAGSAPLQVLPDVPARAASVSHEPGDQDGLLGLAGLALLREAKDTPRARRLIASLMTRGLLGPVCRRIASADAGAAAELLLIASKIDSRMLHSLAGGGSGPAAPSLGTDQLAQLVEAVLMLAEYASGVEAGALDGRLRSALALLSGRLSALGRLGDSLFGDPDPRVRANAIESLWGRSDEDAVARFRAALGDSYPRPVANACVGLYLAGRAEAVRELSNMASHPEPRFRAAAAWAMGRTGHSRFLPLLAEMRSANPAPVSLLKCIVQAKDRILAVQKLPRDEMSLEAGSIEDGGCLTVRVKTGDSEQIPILRPAQWAIELNGTPAWDYDAERADSGTMSAIQTWRLTAPCLRHARGVRLVVSVETGTHWGRTESPAG